MEHYTLDNTEGYTQAELDAMNAHLTEALTLAGLEPHTDAWYEAIKRHADSLAHE